MSNEIQITFDENPIEIIFPDFEVALEISQSPAAGIAGPAGPAGPTGPAGAAGATDHGALTGLVDDDHPQYSRSGHIFVSSNTVLTYLPAQVTVLATAQITLPARSSEAGGRSSIFRCIDTGSGPPTVTLVPAGTDVLLTGSPNQTFNQKTTVLASVADAGMGIPEGWSAVTEVEMLGLGDSALLDVGTTVGTVAAGNDSRFTSTVATSRLGTGTASSTTFLRGDQAWAALGEIGAYKTTTELVLPGVNSQYAYSPDTPFIDITGDIDIRMNLSLTDWTPSQDVSPLSKWGAPGFRSWYLRIKQTGHLGLAWSSNGTDTVTGGPVLSTVPSGIADGVYSWIRATLTVNNGSSQNEVRFYTSTDGVTWTQLGATVTTAGITSIFSSSSDLVIGVTSGFTSVPMSVKRVTLNSTIGGTTPAPFDVLFSSGAANARVIQEVAGGNNGLIFITGLAGVGALAAALNSDPRLNDQRRPFWSMVRTNNVDRSSSHDATSTGYLQIGTMTAARTWVLPALAEIGIGKSVLVYSGAGCSATNTLTVQAYGTETINGTSSSYVITEPNRLITLYSNVLPASTTATSPNWVLDAGPISVKSVTGTAPIAITGTSTAPNVTLGSLDASQTTTGIFTPARLGTGTASADTFLRGDSTWSDDVPLQISVKNTSGGSLTKGTPVYATGTVGATTVVEVAGADASVSAKMPAIGLLMQNLAVNGTGLVMIMGTITGLATTGYNINSGMFVAPGGGLTNTRPTAATDLVQNVARVTRVHATTGSVMVLGPGRTNDVPNLIATNFLATSGTASATTFLRGDQTWATAGGGSGTVTGVTGTAPIVSSGSTTTPAISITSATVSAAGSMSASDKTKLDALDPNNWNWKGEWDSETPYVAGDAVYYFGGAWYAIASSTGITPVVGIKWQPVASAVTGSLPITVSSNEVSIAAATTLAAGSMSSTDKTLLNALGDGYKVITKQVFASPTASVDINPTGYSIVRIVVLGKSDNASASVTVRMRINGSVASEYVINNSASPTTTFNNNGSIPGSLTNTNRQGLWECEFAIGGIGKYTVGWQRGAHMLSNSTAGQSLTQSSLVFINDTAAITSILVFPSAGNFDTGSEVIVLGVV